MAAQYQNPSEYIGHHLTFAAKPISEGGFWTLNLDSIIVAGILGVLGLGFFWWVAKGATSGVPTKRQAFVELCFDFVTGFDADPDDQARHRRQDRRWAGWDGACC